MVTDIKHVGGICIRCKVFPGSHGCQVMLGDMEQKNLGPMHVSYGLMHSAERWSPLYYCSLRQISLCPPLSIPASVLNQLFIKYVAKLVINIYGNELYPFLYSIPVFHSTIPFHCFQTDHPKQFLLSQLCSPTPRLIST